MDFALKQMKAMGWSEGKGLGLSEDGITTALKPSSQMDTRGLGFTIEDAIQLKNQWWNEAYNAASKGLKTEYKITAVGIIVKSKKQENLEINDTNCVSGSNEVYNNRFISAGVLNNDESDNEQETKQQDPESTGKKKKKKSNKQSVMTETIENVSNDLTEESSKKSKTIDFNEVFKQAKGRTCHKGARHGIKMSGKMKRIEEQEEAFLKRLKKS